MKKLDLGQLKKIVTIVKQHRLIVAWFIILGLFGYTLMQAQSISDPEPDELYLSRQREEIETTVLNIDEDLRTQIEGLLETPVDTTPHDLGTRNPFNP